ncbi:MAG: hypothetical protein KKG09_06650 [Verrucomicrobia bacterium]|nr:hypothetical protein [Verrucomicrobiota bacterium]MCG2681004.1 hypothetical protein [Kiritimatiellia bacterium]MBU4247784.1 hypothetical protein [Verrucomicrobiota bacterium]MBU4292072.1 hypothetical protein [Verrucomicrobiota bacterium]MBU4427855.1 hypothetical protein [Verrucomicrobiota bacterium]
MRAVNIPGVDKYLFVARRQRWRKFLQPNAGPGFCFIVRGDDPGNQLPPPPIWPDKAKERIEYKWRAYQHACERAALVNDDFVPYIDMATGTEIFAEAFGCPVHRPADNNPFALPLIQTAAEVASVKIPEVSTSSLAYLFDMADELRRRAGPGAVFHIVDIQSPMGIAALIWEKSAFYVAMLETPEAVKELAAKTRACLTAFLDEWFRRYGTDYVAHCPDYFMSGGMTLSEDEVGVVNEALFVEFFLPELAALSNRYGGLGMHCCADARHQWPHFRSIPGLRLLNLSNPPTRKPEDYILKALPFFRDTCVQWHGGWTPDGTPDTWPEKYPVGCRVVIDVSAENLAVAQSLADKLQAVQECLGGV